MKQNQRQILTIGVILLILVGAGALSSQLAQKQTAKTTSQPSTQTIATTSYQGEDGKTVLELLQRNHKVETQQSSFGTFVTSIDGKTQSENSFWLFYIDGTPASDAADKTITKNGQTIEWRFESF